MTSRFVRRVYSLQGESAGPLIKVGLLMQLGFAAASVAMAALIPLIAGEATASASLPLIVTGITLVTYCWRRAWVVLDRPEPGPGGTPGLAKALEAGWQPLQGSAASVR